jgi:CBS domain containing-hemolysin-like protein
MTSSHKNGAWRHLSQKTCGDVSIDVSMIKSVRGNDSLESVVKALKSRDVLSAPVLDDKQRVLGVIDLTDLLSLLVRELAVSEFDFSIWSRFFNCGEFLESENVPVAPSHPVGSPPAVAAPHCA